MRPFSVEAQGPSPTKAAINQSLNRSNDFMSADQSRATIAEYDRRLKTNPKDYVALYYRGRAYANLHDDKNALTSWQQSRAVNPYRPSAHHTINQETGKQAEFYEFCLQNESFVYFAHGQYKEGIADLDEAIKARPFYATNYKNRAIAYKKLGRPDLAEKDYEALRQLSAEHKDHVSAKTIDGMNVEERSKLIVIPRN